MVKSTLSLVLLLLISSSPFACGTVQNWMDVYEGIESDNRWRDKSSRLDALAMMQSCGNSFRLKEDEQWRLLGILTDAMQSHMAIMQQGSANRDLARESGRYRDSHAYEELIKTIFQRFDCLGGLEAKDLPRFSLAGQNNRTTIYEYFGRSVCH